MKTEEGYSALHEFWNNLRAIPEHLYRAIFRGGAPKTDRTRSSFIFGNVFLHLHSVRTHLWSLRWRATFGLGIVTTAAFLPIVMGVAMYGQFKLNPAPPDPMQAKVFAFMPLIMTVMMAWFPAGLLLYWTTNTLLSIAQQWNINRVVEAESKKAH